MRFLIKILILFLLFSVCFMDIAGNSVSAQVFDIITPSFSLYCEDNQVVKSGKIKYSFDQNGKAEQLSDYYLSGTNDKVDLYIPFISSILNFSEIDIKINEKAVTGDVCYGKKFFINNEYKLNADCFYSSEIDVNFKGTLYTFTSDSKNFTIKLRKSKNQCFIYKLTNNLKTQTDGKNYIYEIYNALPNEKYEIFVVNGDFSEFESTATTVKEALAVKTFLDRNIELNHEIYYDCGGVAPEFFYSLANYLIENNFNYEYYNFFFYSLSEHRLNAYKIKAINLPCNINYTMSVYGKATKGLYNKTYEIEQLLLDDCNIEIKIELNNYLPYIIDSNINFIKQEDNRYKAFNVEKDYYFKFSSSTVKDNYVNSNIKIFLPDFFVLICIIVIAVLLFYTSRKN